MLIADSGSASVFLKVELNKNFRSCENIPCTVCIFGIKTVKCGLLLLLNHIQPPIHTATLTHGKVRIYRYIQRVKFSNTMQARKLCCPVKCEHRIRCHLFVFKFQPNYTSIIWLEFLWVIKITAFPPPFPIDILRPCSQLCNVGDKYKLLCINCRWTCAITTKTKLHQPTAIMHRNLPLS